MSMDCPGCGPECANCWIYSCLDYLLPYDLDPASGPCNPDPVSGKTFATAGTAAARAPLFFAACRGPISAELGTQFQPGLHQALRDSGFTHELHQQTV